MAAAATSGLLPAAEAGSAAAAAEAAPDDPCSSRGLGDYYHLGLHIAAVGILLAVSLAGALLPVALHVGRRRSGTLTAVKLGTFFGIGTILSTAFIHMLLPAHESLTSSCLPKSWTTYDAWAFVFAVLAILGMQLLDFVIQSRFIRALAKGGRAPDGSVCTRASLSPCSLHHDHAHGMLSVHASHPSLQSAEAAALAGEAAAAAAAAAPTGTGGRCGGSMPAAESSMEEGAECAAHDDGRHPLLANGSPASPLDGCASHLHVHLHDATAAGASAGSLSQAVAVYFMELGIVAHSLLIGLVLGVAAGTAFTTLLIALALHQFFEGFALGSAAVDSGMGARRAGMVALIYAVTTPSGIAFGITVHESFSRTSSSALLAEGILDALSAGILIYVVLAQLLSPLVTQSAWLHERSTPVKLISFLCLYAGAAVMAAIGKWA